MTYEPTGLALSIFQERYASHPEETWLEAAQRVADTVARAETGDRFVRAANDFKWEIANGYFMPGGRIMRGAGLPNQQMLNCFVIPTADSKEGWGKSIHDMLVVSATGGGVGGNFSPVRGRGYSIRGNGGVSTGAVSLMQMWNGVGDVLVSGGGRRLALMLCLNIDHPDIEEFITAKLDKGELTNANISIVIPAGMPTEEFQRLVREDGEIALAFNGRPDELGRTVSARLLWDKIVQNAWENGEPGVLNGYEANRQNNVWYAHPLVSTNPCGEIWLPAYGCCDLGALVLPRFVHEGAFDWDKLDESVRLGVRFLDNVLDVNHYPLPEIKAMCQNERRIGLGVMGLHSMLLKLGMKYNSPEAFQFVDKLFGFIKATAYHASIDLAIEKGPFPLYDERMLQSGFCKTLKQSVRRRMKAHGIRNCAMLTIAPTGTTSMVQGVTGGIEPLYSPVYIRRRKNMDEGGRERIIETLVVSKDYQDYPELVQGALDIHPRDHFEMQAIAQRHIDNAVSKTINLPRDFPVGELSDLWLDYAWLKGTTFYRSGSRDFEPMEHVPSEFVLDIRDRFLQEGDGEIEYEGNDTLDCASGVCEI